jgi:hypothetical protein
MTVDSFLVIWIKFVRNVELQVIPLHSLYLICCDSHLGCGNVNVSFDRCINSYQFMYSLCATTIICVLQWSLMADSQPSLTHVTSEKCMYSNRCVLNSLWHIVHTWVSVGFYLLPLLHLLLKFSTSHYGWNVSRACERTVNCGQDVNNPCLRACRK